MSPPQDDSMMVHVRLVDLRAWTKLWNGGVAKDDVLLPLLLLLLMVLFGANPNPAVASSLLERTLGNSVSLLLNNLVARV